MLKENEPFKRKSKPTENVTPRWIVTFSDLITLILVFFILLFSMSQIDAIKFKAVAESFEKRQTDAIGLSIINFDFLAREDKSEKKWEVIVNEEKEKQESKKDDLEEQDDDELELMDLLKIIQQYLDDHNLNTYVKATRESSGVMIVIEDRALFNSGEAVILPKAKGLFETLASLLATMNNPIYVEGHTDNVPISTVRYPSNWELSTARASSVVRFLQNADDISEWRFLIRGYADTKPVASNKTEDGRSANRRVVILIEDRFYKQ